MQPDILKKSQLGKATTYIDQYKPDLLFPIPRANNRSSIAVDDADLPFFGVDLWNGYEFSWLDRNGMPHARRIQIIIPCASKYLVESKSFKLYLYSFANSKFDSEAELINIIENDLTKAIGDLPVTVRLFSFDRNNVVEAGFDGILLDNLPITCSDYQVQTEYLQHDDESSGEVCETVCSNLLKSNCLVTGHPDWGSIKISYTGKKISHEGLLKYIVSFREHQEFHEHCVERIFADILRICKPNELHVEARYTRRGGLDINPIRAIKLIVKEDIRLFRQ